MTRLLVVVVNHRTAALVEEGLVCLESQVARHPGRRVVVVDNDSQDGSFERLTAFVERRGFGTWASVVAAPNDGFAAGNNVALAPALASATPPDFVLLLNPDALVRPGAIDALLEFAARTPKAGLMGSRLIHRDGRVQASTFRFPSLMTELLDGARLGPLTRAFAKHHILAPLTDTPSRTDWVAGASLLVRREVFDALGLMDTGYFLYFEETDFCRRAAAAGFECWYVPQSEVVHLVGQSTGVTNTEAARRRRPHYWFASRRRYFTKHFGRTRTVLIDTVFVLAHLSWRVRCALSRQPSDEPAHFLADFVRHSFLGASSASAPARTSAERESRPPRRLTRTERRRPRGYRAAMNASASALALTFTRLVLGGIALVHGLANTFGLFGGPGHEKMAAEIAARISAAPEILAWVISIGQLVAGLALVLGVFARSAALLMLVLVVANAVALTRYEAFFVRDNGLEYPLALAALCLAVAAQGAGALRLQLGSKNAR